MPAMVVADPMPSTPATPTSGHMVVEIGKDRRVIVDAGVDAAALARVSAAQMSYLLEAIDCRNSQHTWRPQSAG